MDDLRKQKTEDLEKEIINKRSALMDLTFDIRSSQEPDISKRKKAKREIAQIMTVLSERKLEQVIDKDIEESQEDAPTPKKPVKKKIKNTKKVTKKESGNSKTKKTQKSVKKDKTTKK